MPLWRLAGGLVAFFLWAPLSLAGFAPWALVGIPLAALLAASRPHRPAAWGAALAAGALSVGLLAAPVSGRWDALVRAYTVLAAAAFVGEALLRPVAPLRMATRAMLVGGAATSLLARLLWDGDLALVQWEATREAGRALRVLTGYVPAAAGLGDLLPAVLALQTFAGLALAWQWHHRLSDRPLGEPLGPFREFRFGDHWVWGVVAAGVVWIVPKLAALKGAALNLTLILGALYVLRGAAIVTAVAEALGVSTGALVGVAVGAAVFVLPLLVLVPGLWALGITDTWLEVRRRLARQPTPS